MLLNLDKIKERLQNEFPDDKVFVDYREETNELFCGIEGGMTFGEIDLEKVLNEMILTLHKMKKRFPESIKWAEEQIKNHPEWCE